MTPWENDVAAALREVATGRSANWDATAHTLAAEIHRLRANLADMEASIPDPGYESEVPHGV